MLLFPSKQTAPLNYHYKTVKVQKSSLHLSCIRISLLLFLFICLQLWSWDFTCFTSDSDIFWKVSGKVLSSVSMLSNHTLQNKNEAEALASSGWEGLFPSCLMVPVGYHEAQGGQKVFLCRTVNFCDFSIFLPCDNPKAQELSFFPSSLSPLGKQIHSHSDNELIVPLQEQLSGIRNSEVRELKLFIQL